MDVHVAGVGETVAGDHRHAGPVGHRGGDARLAVARGHHQNVQAPGDQALGLSLPAGEASNDVDPHADGPVIRDLPVSRPAVRARFIRIHAEAPIMCPDWHKGAGNRSFIFADEISVD